MFQTLLIIHLIVCVALIGSILMQRSEGGGALGIGGGPSGLMSGRAAANFMTKTTSVLATLFFILTIALTITSGATKKDNTSVLETDPKAGGLPTKSIELDKPAEDSAIPQSQVAPLGNSLFGNSVNSTDSTANAVTNTAK